MKLLALLLLPTLLFSQSNLDGIYKLKPGVTDIGIIDELQKELKIKVVEISDYMNYYNKVGYRFIGISGRMTPKDAFVHIINANTKQDIKKEADIVIPYAPYSKDHQVYFISKIPVSGIKLEGVLLFFRQNILVKVECEKTDDLMNAMEIKFGKGLVETKTDTVKCLYKLTGNEIKQAEYTITTTWKGNDVEAYSYARAYFDENCKGVAINKFYITSNSLFSKYTDEEIEAEKSVKAVIADRQKSATKEKMNGF